MGDAPFPLEAIEAHERGVAAARQNDVEGAEHWWRVAAEAGVPDAAFQLGYLAETRNDHAEAERWHRQAAEGGHSGGMLGAGAALEKQGRKEEALTFYRRAWDEDADDMAAFNLGRIYDDDGKGDLAAAAEW
jgi:TPR repeat protein